MVIHFLIKYSFKKWRSQAKNKKSDFLCKIDVDSNLKNDYNVGKLRGKTGVIL